jgi:xanthosine utilization system XapX-like protein
MSFFGQNRAIQRYNKRVIVLSLIYAITLVGAVYGFKHHLVAGVFAWIVAVLPALPIVGIFAVIGLYLVEEQDEYVRVMTVRQTLWASAFALSITTIWGFLESFELVQHVESYWVSVLWFGGLGLGTCANRLSTVGRRS